MNAFNTVHTGEQQQRVATYNVWISICGVIDECGRDLLNGPLAVAPTLEVSMFDDVRLQQCSDVSM